MASNPARFGPEADLNLLTQAEVLAHFDACVDSGVIKFDGDFITKSHTVDGIDVSDYAAPASISETQGTDHEKFEFRISQALQTKPHETSSPLASTLNTDSKPRPGSDLMTAGTEIAALGDTHFLAFNGFACYRPHYLMLTNDGYGRQWEPLDEDDFAAVHALMDSAIMGGPSGRGEYLMFFNGGVDAGCSRVHKHLQAIPQESYGGDPWKNLDQGVMPFAYYEKTFNQDDVLGPKTSFEAYKEGLQAVERSIGAATTDVNEERRRAPAHTVLMDRERIVVIPRVAAGTGGVGANAAGMLGMIWVQSEEAMEKWMNVGPQKVLKAAGVSRLS
jgi:ATP adenylyltransferase